MIMTVKHTDKPKKSKWRTVKDIAGLVAFLLIICATSLIMCGAADHPQAQIVTETYTVCKGDTLDSIADKFIVKNTYGARQHDEFKEGICEVNSVRQVKAGDKLIVNYVIKK
jgi:hypothetical protein